MLLIIDILAIRIRSAYTLAHTCSISIACNISIMQIHTPLSVSNPRVSAARLSDFNAAATTITLITTTTPTTN